MEGPCLFMVIAGLLAGSVICHEVASSYSGCQWNNVHFLNCRSTGITTLGEHFFLDQTTKNVTSSNHLQRCIRTTTHIDLSYNMMSALYLNVFYKFASLETLNLKNNQIYKMSMNEKNEKGAFLTSLQRLVLNGNRLIAIPKGLCKLKSLQTLSLSANRILYVQGDDFANCTNLQHIDLGENRISNIHADSFRDLRNLQVLKLNSNTLLSLSPMVFLFKHILKADIDLSDNPWVCDCSLQPLKYLISSLSTGVRKPWNATCRTPFSKAGQLILSVEISKSCQTSEYSHVFDKTLLITAGEEATLDCESFNQLRNKDILWWTPHGIISNERQNSNYYLSNTNSLIIKQPNDSDEGLYLCLTNAARIAYQVGIQVNNLKSIRRSPRDLQLRNVRMPSQQNFDLAVSLSVIVTFLIAFFLGVFIRPYLESLWRKGCKSKNAEAQHSDEVYENDGFTPDFTTRKDGAKSNVSSLPQHKTGQIYEMNDNYILETENITQRQERAIDVEIPTHNAVQEIGEDINKPANRLPRTKRVKWASNEDISANVNLKYLMSLIKPINFIVLDSSMPDMVYDHQSNNTITEDFNHISGHTNDDTTKISDDSCSSDEGSSFSLGSDYDVSDNDSTVNEVLQETKQGGQDCTDNVSPTINLKHFISLLKPIHIIVPDSTVPVISKSPKQNKDTFKTLYDTNSSDESYIYAFDSEYELSDEDEILNVNVLETKKSNVSPTVNLKYVMSLLKPINIIVPETTTTQIVKSPKQKQFFPLTMPEYPENRMENLEHFPYIRDQDKQITNDQCKSLLPNIYPIHYTTGLNDSSFSDEESNISVNSENNFSAEDAFIGYNFLKTQTQLANETLSPTVNLKHLISLLRPINITIPDSTIPTVIRTSTQQQLFPISISRYPANKMENADISSDNYDKDNSIQAERSECYLESTDPRNQYSDSKNSTEVTWPAYDSSSSEDSSNDTDDSDQATSSVLTKPLPGKWVSNEIAYPTVNLRQIISTLKPIQIKVPDACHYSETLVSPKEDLEVTSEKLYYYSSSDEHSNDSVDSDHDSTFEFVTKTFPVPAPRKRADSEKVNYSVNLKNIISSLKPIHINIPDSTYYSDTLVTLKMNTEVTQDPEPETLSESSNDSADSEHERFDEEVIISPNVYEPMATEMNNHEDLTPVVNLKYIISSLKPMNIKYPDTTDLLVSSDKNNEVKLHDRSSSDEEFNDLDDLEHEDSYKNVIRGQSLPKPISNESSNDSVDLQNDGSTEDVICQLNVTTAMPADWEKSMNVYPTVNLKHVTSLLKPFHINVPDSNNYSDPQVFPKKNIEATQKQFDSTSSDESSNDPFDPKYESADEEVVRTPALLPTTGTEWASIEDLPPTVNLKQIISSLKPIHINIPDTTCNSDILVKKDTDDSQKLYDFSISDTTTSESSNDSADSENEDSDEKVEQSIILPEATTEWKNHDYPIATVNLKHVISSLKPFHINVPDSTNYSDPQVFPKENIDATQKLFDSTFSDESSNDPFDSKYENSDEELIKAPALLVTTGTGWVSSEDLPPTVNLKQIMSSLKPIHISIPDTTCNLDILVKKDIDVAQKPYDFSISDTRASDSSDDSTESEHEGSDEEVNQSIIFPEATTECKNHDYPTATVNLKHVISSLKPFHVNVPDSTNYSDPQVFPKKNIDATQKLFDSISSDESSNDPFNSKYESSDEEVMKTPPLLVTTGTEWVSSEDLPPTVNLKQIMSSLKPICIKVPDADHYSNFPFQTNINTKDNHPLYDGTLSDEGSNNSVSSSEDIMHSIEDIMSRSYVADTAETTPNLYGSGSSDEDSNESSDLECEGLDGEMRSAILHIPTLKEAANNGNVYATINLKHVISLLKPMCFAVSDSTPYSDTLVHSKNNIEEVTQSSYNSISSDELSNDSSHSRYKDSDEEVIMSSALLEPPTTDWVNDKNHTPTVNLEHVISSFKPICIVVADSYKMTTVVTPKLCDHSSSDERSNDSADLEHECLSEHLMTFPLPKPIQTGQESNENVCPTVNLKHLISLINPIQIKVPDATCYLDIVTSPKENIETTIQKLHDYNPSDESSNGSVDSEHESSDEDIIRTTNIPKRYPTWASDENLSFTVNLRHLMSTFKPLDITVAHSTKHLGTSLSPNTDTEVMQKLYGDILPDTIPNDSDNSDSKGSEDVVISNLSEIVSTKLPSNEKVYTTVNLKNVISLFKPISIKHPHSTNYSESFIIPTKAVEVSKELYKNSSSDESSAESGHEGSYEVTNHRMRNNSSTDDDSTDEESMLKDSHKGILLDQHSTLPKPTPTEWARNENLSPTVNLRHIISLLKPLKIKIQDSAYHSGSPKKNMQITQEKYDNSSHDNSSADSEHEYPDTSVIKSSSLPKLTPTEKVPESNPYEDTPMTSKKNIEVTSDTVNNISLPNEYSNYFADSDQEGSVEYMERRTEQERQRHVYPTVNLKHLTSLLKPIRIKVPDAAHYSDTLKSSKKKNKVTAEKYFDTSSSDESSKDSTDSEHENSNENIMSSKLAKPTLTEWASTEIAYPTVNLKNVTSLLKPINIMAPDSAVPEVPTWKPHFSDSTRYKENETDNFDKYQQVSHSFSQPKSKLHNKHYKHHFSYAFKNSGKNKNVILTSYKKMLSNNTSDNIDEWSHKGLNKSDTTNSDLLTSNLAAGASNEDDAPVVNLKHVMSLLKPVKFVDAALTNTELVKHPPPVPPRKSRKKFQEQSSLSFHEKPMESRFPVQYATVSKDLSQNDLIKFDTDDLEEVVL